jgi:protein-S-isoprenylcysteine O-methyltransferase Ste14
LSITCWWCRDSFVFYSIATYQQAKIETIKEINMQSLFLRNLFFTILQPGIVAGLIPFLLAKEDLKAVLHPPFTLAQYSGVFIFLAGIFIMSHCIIKFAIDGRGTLSPADPTKMLVISGLYKYSRNPMYVGVMLILIGETIFTLNVDLLLYSCLIFVAFNLFIHFREEPRLKKDFGVVYENYKKQVRRWI